MLKRENCGQLGELTQDFHLDWAAAVELCHASDFRKSHASPVFKLRPVHIDARDNARICLEGIQDQKHGTHTARIHCTELLFLVGFQNSLNISVLVVPENAVIPRKYISTKSCEGITLDLSQLRTVTVT